jgi:hypothetical protein
VQFNKQNIEQALTLMPIILGAYTLLFLLSYGLYYLVNYYIALFVQIILGSIVALFAIGLLFSYFMSHNDKPAAILNENGIWMPYYNLIPWDTITEFDTVKVSTTPLEYIGIRVKDLSKLSKQSNFSGKSAIFWSRITGYPPITLANIELTNEEVIAFAQQFLNKNI